MSVRAPLPLIVFALVLWSVAWLPLEDSLGSLRFASPRRAGFLIGSVLLVLLVIRGSLVERYNDPFIVILPFGFALALSILCRPKSNIFVFREEMLTLSLLPVITWLPPLIPEKLLSRSGALFASMLLQLFGIDAFSSDTRVVIEQASVNIAGPCSGNEMIAQSIVVALLAVITFPLPTKAARLPVFALAPIFAWAANGLRIALLALIAYNSPESAKNDSGVFSFFHLGEGGMLFSSLGIGLFAYVYVKILDRQLRGQNR
jgi:exosortase/archaeosortase family protein